MRTQNRRFRLIASVSVAGLLITQMVPQPATAQGAPPPPPQVGVPAQQSGDPPERVGRLAQLSGAVSFHAQDDSQWNPATLNYPVTQGSAFWTEPNAQAVIEVSASRIAMAPGTELDIAALTGTACQATEPQGEVYLNLRPAAPDETYAVQTPRGMVTFAVPGRYGVVAGDIQTPTVVTAIEGSAHVEGPGVSLDVGPGQAASISGSDTFQGQVGPAQRDAFLTAMLDSEHPPQPQGIAPPQVVAEMPGGDDLAQYGSWAQTQDYGEVWYPPGGARLGALPGRKLGLRRSLGLDVDGQRPVGLRAVPLRPLGRDRRTLGLDPRRRVRWLSPGLCARTGHVRGRRCRGGRRRGCRARRGPDRLAAARAA